MDLFLMEHENSPSIKIVEEYELIQGILCETSLFKQFKNDEWNLDQDSLLLTINQEEVNIIFDSVFETYLLFDSKSLRDQVFKSLQNTSDEDLNNEWKESSSKILEKLNSNHITVVKEGILELTHWVTDYNNQYVDNQMNSVDLSLFGYVTENWPEGDLWPNPVFDNLLETYKNKLNEDDLLHLIHALFNKNEDYMDCKATYTAISFLLEKRTPEIELSIVAATIKALEGYEAGHRYYERSLLDRLIDDIFPTFSVISIIELLKNLKSDNLKGEHLGGQGDNFISLAHSALDKKTNTEQKETLQKLIQEHIE